MYPKKEMTAAAAAELTPSRLTLARLQLVDLPVASTINQLDDFACQISTVVVQRVAREIAAASSPQPTVTPPKRLIHPAHLRTTQSVTATRSDSPSSSLYSEDDVDVVRKSVGTTVTASAPNGIIRDKKADGNFSAVVLYSAQSSSADTSFDSVTNQTSGAVMAKHWEKDGEIMQPQCDRSRRDISTTTTTAKKKHVIPAKDLLQKSNMTGWFQKIVLEDSKIHENRWSVLLQSITAMQETVRNDYNQHDNAGAAMMPSKWATLRYQALAARRFRAPIQPLPAESDRRNQNPTPATLPCVDMNYMFCQIGHGFIWTELDVRPQDAIAKLWFKGIPTCHDVCRVADETVSYENRSIDVVIGFYSGELIWYSPVRSKYLRLNKGGKISKAPVTRVRWLPGSRCLFAACFADGRVAIFDKEKEDNPNTIEDDWISINGASEVKIGTGADESASQSTTAYLLINNSGELKKHKRRYNPQSLWKVQPPRRQRHNLHFSNNSTEHALRRSRCTSVSRQAAMSPNRPPHSTCVVTSFEFRSADNPANKLMAAITTSTGVAYVVDLSCTVADTQSSDQPDITPRVLDIYHSYFGGFICSRWSPDGKYLALGGQDDSILLVCVGEKRIAYRLEGHQNWVNDLLFLSGFSDRDSAAVASVGDEDTMRLLSVGEDGFLCVWDIERQLTDHRRHTIFSLPRRKSGMKSTSISTQALSRKDFLVMTDQSSPSVHQAPSLFDTPILAPALCQLISPRPLTSLATIIAQNGGRRIAATDRSGCLHILQLSSVDEWAA